tara:strand:- start:4191 stop:4523 length:333 start_codon:yes stop_codon:yes gene_type:complete
MSSFTKPAKAVITSSTAITEIVPAQGGNSFINMYSITMSNTSLTDTFVEIYDGATLVTPGIAVPSGLGHSINLAKPLRFAQNSALSVKSSASVASLNVAVFYDVEPNGNG